MTDDERRILAFEDNHPRNNRGKEAAIRTAFGMSWVRYRQILARLVTRADVVGEYAVVAHRVQRTTERGVTRRAARTFR